MDRKKEFKAFVKQVIENPYSDAEELTAEHEMIFDWFWNRYTGIRVDAWKYRDLSK